MYRQPFTSLIRHCIKLSVTPIERTEHKFIHRWVAPTLRQLKVNRDKVGAPPLEPRSALLEWNYDAEIFAFGKRLDEEFDEGILRKALTHRSYAKSEEDKNGVEIEDNSQLIERGYDLIRRCLRMEFGKVYPEVLVKVVRDHLMTTEMLAYVASHIGLKDIILCKEFPVEDTTLANSFASIVAALEASSGLERAEKFVKDFLIAQINGKDVYDLWKLDDAYGYLQMMLKKKNIEPRLCNQSGVGTILANYEVGLYSDQKLLGIGFGETIDLAKHTAALDAIRKIYDKHNPSTL